MPKTTPSATYDDVNLILRLYEQRREERMRQARAWFAASFTPKTWAEVAALAPPGSEENASMRMFLTYWEMVATFIVTGVLNEDLFFQSGRELLLAYGRIRAILPDQRKAFKDPYTFKNLETVGESFIKWLNGRAPGSYEAFAERLNLR